MAALVQRLLPTASAATVPFYPMGVQPVMSGVIASEAVPGYNPGASNSIASVYSSLMPPPPHPSQSYSQLLDTSSSTRYTRPEETSSSSSARQIPSLAGSSTSTSSPILQTALHSPSLARHRALAGDITSGSSVRHSPLSLASITSPHHSDPQHPQLHSQIQSQPKNCHAQTLILGERLRHGSGGLVVSQTRLSRRCWSITPYRRRVFLHLRLWFLLVPQPHFIFNKRGHLAISEVVVATLVHLLHGVRIESD